MRTAKILKLLTIFSVQILSLAAILMAEDSNYILDNSQPRRDPFSNADSKSDVWNTNVGGAAPPRLGDSTQTVNTFNYLNPNAGMQADMNSAERLGQLIGSMGTAGGLARQLIGNLQGVAGDAVANTLANSQGDVGNTILAQQHFLQQTAQSQGGEIPAAAMAYCIKRRADGMRDTIISADECGGRQLLDIGSSLAVSPSHTDQVLNAYALKDDPRWPGHNPGILGLEVAKYGNIVGLNTGGSLSPTDIVNARFKNRMTDYLFNSKFTNALSGGGAGFFGAVAGAIDSVQFWNTKAGWWEVFGDTVYGLGEVEINAGSILADVNRSSQELTTTDINGPVGAQTKFRQMRNEAFGALSRILHYRCDKTNDGSAGDPTFHWKYDNDASLKPALAALAAYDFSITEKDLGALFSDFTKQRGGSSEACRVLSDEMAHSEDVTNLIESGHLDDHRQQRQYFLAVSMAHMKFNDAVRYAKEMVQNRITNGLPQYVGRDAMRLIEKAEAIHGRDYAQILANFEETTKGLAAMGASRSGAGGMSSAYGQQKITGGQL